MTGRKTASTITDAELDQLYDDLAALRAVARGYCPACGRGDATPPVEAYEEQRQRAAQAEATITRVRKAIDSVKAAGRGWTPTTDADKGAARAVDWVTMRILEAIDTRLVTAPEAATEATEPPPLAIPRDMATTLHRTLGQLLGDQDAQAIARLRELHHEDYGSCAECTHESGVPWPCPTIRTLDNQEQPRV